MDRYRYFIFNQKSVLVLGVLQVACAGLCVVCGFMDAVFRRDTPLSTTRTPVWGALIMASPGVLALFASQRKNSVLTFVLHRMVKGANATILLTCTISLALSSLIAYLGCRSLPCCGCYDARTGLLQLMSLRLNALRSQQPCDVVLLCVQQLAMTGSSTLQLSPLTRAPLRKRVPPNGLRTSDWPDTLETGPTHPCFLHSREEGDLKTQPI
ncbi:uncharacterized protein zgc:113425 isoform X3 [Micropterus salmoides]|uniref:uncharacterized protein zgc:113425 isoform X3 n=1 Tax=Micropterus salmoides TaxID=27706 RepID=UPI0018ED7493|nr:uncharacterized protein zgc:113425 isoform X3 [Micropterus salmoides]